MKSPKVKVGDRFWEIWPNQAPILWEVLENGWLCIKADGCKYWEPGMKFSGSQSDIDGWYSVGLNPVKLEPRKEEIVIKILKAIDAIKE